MFSMSWFRIPIVFVVEVCMKKFHMWVRYQALKIANGDDNGAIKCDHFKTTWWIRKAKKKKSTGLSSKGFFKRVDEHWLSII